MRERARYIDPANDALANGAGDVGDRVQARHQDSVLLGAEGNVVHCLEQICPAMAALESLRAIFFFLSVKEWVV